MSSITASAVVPGPPQPERIDKLLAAAQVERQALVFTLAAMLLTALAALLFVRDAQLPLTGDLRSVAGISLLVTIVIAAVAGPVAYWQGALEDNRANKRARRHDFRWSIAPITVGVTIASAVTMMAVWETLGNVFTNAALYRSFYVIVLTAIAGAVTYVIYTLYARIDAVSLLYLSLLGLFASFFFSALMHPNPYWWEFSFSHLGTEQSDVRFLFNIGLVLTAILLIAWQQFFMEDIMVLQQHGLMTARTQRFLRVLLIAMALGAGGTGAVRWGISPFLNFVHTVAASGFGIAAGLILVSLPWTMPFHSREFLFTSYTLLGLTLLVVLFRVLGDINLVGMQIGATMLGSFWIILFVRNTKMLVDQQIAQDDVPIAMEAPIRSAATGVAAMPPTS
jgi:hypothetical protein